MILRLIYNISKSILTFFYNCCWFFCYLSSSLYKQFLQDFVSIMTKGRTLFGKDKRNKWSFAISKDKQDNSDFQSALWNILVNQDSFWERSPC